MRLPACCTSCRGDLDPRSAVVLWITRARVWRHTGARTELVRSREVLCDECSAALLITVDARRADAHARAVDAETVRNMNEMVRNANDHAETPREKGNP